MKSTRLLLSFSFLLLFSGCDSGLDKDIDIGLLDQEADICEVDCEPTCSWSCDFNHGSGDCVETLCELNACDEGWGDCDDIAGNGCESALLHSPLHCGTCGLSCRPGEQCEEGACQCGEGEGCAPNERCCEGSCVAADDESCLCGEQLCGEEEVCCSGACLDFKLDSSCGACDGVCDSAQHCVSAVCDTVQGCEEGELRCEGDRAMRCVEGLWTQIEVCGEGLYCLSGSCRCERGTRCEDQCVFTDDDPEHCGSCGNRCAEHPNVLNSLGTSCVGGICHYSCEPDFEDCNADPGCESNLLDDEEHCGECYNECPSGLCSDGECEIDD